MNQKIKIIELLNRIANREEVPRKIIFLNEVLEYDKDCQDYKSISKTEDGAFFTYLSTYQSIQDFINNRVEIIEDTIEEIEELEKEQEAIANPITRLQEVRFYYDSKKMGDKVNELVKAVNSIARILSL